MNNRVFIATPISGFADDNEYRDYRYMVFNLIACLRKNAFEVYAEIENIEGSNEYDTPARSVEIDFENIRKCDYFILLHPRRMQSSSLIEFGYACALDKKIVAVGRKEDFPYLVIGYGAYSEKARIVDVDELIQKDFPAILESIKSI